MRDQARAFDIAGWVRNLSSGNIEVAATGSDEGIRSFMAAVRVGPTGAAVKQIISLSLQPSLEFPRPFTILK